MANAIRALAMDAVEQAKSGHPGMPMGMADVATVLFTQFSRFDPREPDWPDRDRFVLSAGHGSMLLHALLYLTGYADMTVDEQKRFRQLGSRTAGHPERGHASGIETTTGPLGQGFGNSVGMALAERLLAAEFGEEIVDHHTYVIASDGDLMEGISHEAASLAGHLGLKKLIVFYDDNSVSIDGPTELAFSDDPLLRFRGYGWATERIDGHDHEAVANAVRRAHKSDGPSLIACRTTIAFGAPTKAGTAASHGAPLGAAEIAGARDRLGWNNPPFMIPEDILREWRAAGARGETARGAWEAVSDHSRLSAVPNFNGVSATSCRPVSNCHRGGVRRLPPSKCQSRDPASLRHGPRHVDSGGARARRRLGRSDSVEQHQGQRPEGRPPRRFFWPLYPLWRTGAWDGGGDERDCRPWRADPYGGTFLTFSDYARPSIRLSAFIGVGVIYVMTHDSIGLGEDGPTHQPVEHLAALRAIPGLYVYRPADPVETAECWALAVQIREAPSLLALTRQSLPLLRREGGSENCSARGAYVIAEAAGARQVTLLATGSEVSVAMAAREALAKDKIQAAVVSMPCWEIFAKAPREYRDAVLGSAPRVGVEAAIGFGWDRWLGSRGAFIGMEGFGASAPGEALFPYFGITPEKVAEAARSLL